MNTNKGWPLLILSSFTLIMCHIDNHKLLLINNTNKAYYYSLLTDTADLKQGLYINCISVRDSIRPLFVRGGDGA